MNPSMSKPLVAPGYENEKATPSLRSIVRKSALLNLTIILTSFPVLVFAGGPNAVVPALAIMAGISVVVWTATFTLFSFITLARIFWTPASSLARGEPLHHQAREAGVADRWLDGPV
jgi:hypothetical protein